MGKSVSYFRKNKKRDKPLELYSHRGIKDLEIKYNPFFLIEEETKGQDSCRTVILVETCLQHLQLTSKVAVTPACPPAAGEHGDRGSPPPPPWGKAPCVTRGTCRRKAVPGEIFRLLGCYLEVSRTMTIVIAIMTIQVALFPQRLGISRTHSGLGAHSSSCLKPCDSF